MDVLCVEDFQTRRDKCVMPDRVVACCTNIAFGGLLQ
jgi:hypothetical protein